MKALGVKGDRINKLEEEIENDEHPDTHSFSLVPVPSAMDSSEFIIPISYPNSWASQDISIQNFLRALVPENSRVTHSLSLNHSSTCSNPKTLSLIPIANP